MAAWTGVYFQATQSDMNACQYKRTTAQLYTELAWSAPRRLAYGFDAIDEHALTRFLNSAFAYCLLNNMLAAVSDHLQPLGRRLTVLLRQLWWLIQMVTEPQRN